MALQDECDDEDWGNWGSNNANTIIEQTPVNEDDLSSWQTGKENKVDSQDKENKWDNDQSNGTWGEDTKPSKSKWDDDSKVAYSKSDDNRSGGYNNTRNDNRQNNKYARNDNYYRDNYRDRYDDRNNERVQSYQNGDNDRRTDRGRDFSNFNDRGNERRNDRDNDKRNFNERSNDKRNDGRNFNERGNERRDFNDGGNERRDFNDRGNERRDFNDRGNERRDFNDKGNERRDFNDKGNERRDFNDKGNERRDFNDKGNERRDFNDKGNDRRNYNDRDNERRDFSDRGNDRQTYNDRDNNFTDRGNDRRTYNDRDIENRDFNDRGNVRRNFNDKGNDRRNYDDIDNTNRDRNNDRRTYNDRDNENRDLNDRGNNRRTYNDRDNENYDLNDRGNDRRTYNDRDNERRNFGDKGNDRRTYNDRDNDFNDKGNDRSDFNDKGNDRRTYNDRDNGNRILNDYDDLSDRFQNKTNLNDEGRCFQKGNKDGDNNEEPPVVRRATYIPNDDEQDYELHVNSGINFDNYEKIPVDVSGDNIPNAISKFSDITLPEFLMKNIEAMKYTKLTPVQKYAIPIIESDRDLMACAQTGSGKTAAFLLPIIVSLFNNRVETETSNSQVAFPKALIMAPTRELCRQIFTAARQLCQGSELKCAYIYGGIEMNKSRRNLQASGCDILVATPGRLIHFLELVWVSLRYLKYFVLDEGDRMLEKDGFYESVNKISEEANFTGDDRKIQISMFSATFPNEIQDLAKNILKDYIFLRVGVVGSANSDVKQEIIKADQKEKMNLAIDYIKNIPNEKTLIFVQSKRMADFFGIKLGYLGYKATTIHGDREQEQREMALNDFKSGRVNFMVATNVAARGLDIPMVDTVINIDMPDDIDTYVHRIGRTGRCGNVGRAVSFFDETNDIALAGPLIRTLQEANQECPDWLNSMSGYTGGRKQTYAKDIRRDMQTAKFVDTPSDNFMKGSNADYDDDEQSEWLKD